MERALILEVTDGEEQYPAVVMPYLTADKNVDTADLATEDSVHPCELSWRWIEVLDRRVLTSVIDSPEQVDGMPLHVQIVARRYMDEELLRASGMIDMCLK